MNILLSIISAVTAAFSPASNDVSTPSWSINGQGAIEWSVQDGELPHRDHLEMSGEKISVILNWDIDKAGTLSFDRCLAFPSLRIVPNTTHGSLIHHNYADIPSYVRVNGLPLQGERVRTVIIDGKFYASSDYADSPVKIERTVLPSVDKPLAVERYVLTNTGKRRITVIMPEISLTDRTLPEHGVNNTVYCIKTSCKGVSTDLGEGESVNFDVCIQAYRDGVEEALEPDCGREITAREEFVHETSDSLLVLDTPDDVVNTMFRYSKIRGAESIFDTKCGLMPCPGGVSYYAAVWANDQAEYINSFFPYLGYGKGNDAALNTFRLFSRYINDGYKPIPCAVVSEGDDYWTGDRDRGDAAMIAYGASRFALTLGDRDVAEELWPLISWCLEYCRRNLNDRGAVKSDTDELENRFESGDANLCTSSLYYDALTSASYLADELGIKGDFKQRSRQMAKAIESYFGAEVQGYETYRYYDGNTLLRSWIGIPLTMGIRERAEGTVNALLGPELWTEDGVRTEQGNRTFWDRATLYALRGVFHVGYSDAGIEKMHAYSHRRLLEDHVPYAIEAYPEGGKQHLSSESGLYCRIVTEGIFGIRPTGFASFDLTPSIPSAWNCASLRHIKAFGRDFDLEITRDSSGKLTIVLSEAGLPARKFKTANGQTVHVDFHASSGKKNGVI